MKNFEFILSVLIFCMSLVPCGDVHEADICTTESNQLVQEQSHDHNHDGHSHGEHDHCTPFCVCACCGLTLQVVSPINLLLAYEQPTFAFAHDYEFSYSHTYQSTIWHPPALTNPFFKG